MSRLSLPAVRFTIQTKRHLFSIGLEGVAVGEASYSDERKKEDYDGNIYYSNQQQRSHQWRQFKQHSKKYRSGPSRTERNVFKTDGSDDNSDVECFSGSEAATTDEETEYDFSTDYQFTDDREYSFEAEENDRNKYDESRRLYKKVDDDKFVLLEHEILKNGVPLSDHVKIRKIRPKDKRQYYDPLLPAAELERKLRDEPEKYKRCILKIEGAHYAVCKNVNEKDKLSSIEISGRSKCGRVFNGDEVLVEILNVDQVREETIQRFQKDINKHNMAFGRVVGCFRTSRPMDSHILGQDPLYEHPEAEDVSHPVFVCTLDESCNYLMKPVCKTIPKIHALHNPRKTYLVKVFKYCNETRDFEFSRNIKIDPSNASSYIFVVVYINWTCNYPLGMVIDAIHTEDSFDTGMRMLRMLHQVPLYYQRETVQQVEKLQASEDKLMEELTKGRQDFSETLRVFTIDPPGSRDLDDALSIEHLEDGMFRVGVHIADVTSVVKKDDPVDKEAQERATTYYPGQGINPYHMLPEPISTFICSLVEGQKRAAISLFFTLSRDGEVKKLDVKKTVIKSCRQYTYEEVQHIIDDDENDEINSVEIRALYTLAKGMRQRRLGPAMHSLPVEAAFEESGNSSSNAIEAHYLVEEFMVLANHDVGRILMSKCPACVPLRCQSPPSEEMAQKWLEENKYIADSIMRLQGIQPFSGRRISLQNIPNDARYTHIMMLQSCSWNAISVANDRRDPETDERDPDINAIRDIVGSDELHPNIALALDDWIEFQETARYRCSGDLASKPLEAKHFSLAIWPYVHFTSPIRRYPDIVIHRQLTAILEGSQIPYSSEEVSDLCDHFNHVIKNAKQYQKECQTLIWGKRLQKTPILINGYVKATSESDVSLAFPGMRKMPAKFRELPLKLLGLSSRPDFTTDTQLTLKWSRRIYHRRGKHIFKNEKEEKPLECQRLDPYQRTHFVLIKHWKALHDAMSTNDADVLHKAIKRCPRKVNLSSLHHIPEGIVKDINSEFPDGNILRQTCDYSMTFCKGQVLSVQISAEPEKGVMVPSPQLFNLTRNSKYCLQHTRDPVKFLAKYATTSAYSNKYSSEEHYLSVWRPLLEMEFATSAAHDHAAAININAVPVEFKSKTSGTFKLGIWYCEERDIEFTCLSRKYIVADAARDREDEANDVKYCTDYLCIRCEIPMGMPPGTYMRSDTPPKQGYVWLAHAQIKSVSRIEEPRRIFPSTSESSQAPQDGEPERKVKKWMVDFELHPGSLHPTEDMMKPNEDVRCCIEIIQKSESDR